MKYKVGDKVKIKSLDWYNKNKNKYGEVDCNKLFFIPVMKRYCGSTVTIVEVMPIVGVYHIKEDNFNYNWTDEMFEENKNKIIDIKWCEDNGFIQQIVNVASDLTYYYDVKNYGIITYTKSTLGRKKLSVYNYNTKSLITIERNGTIDITETDLEKLCEIIEIEIPFK